MSEFVTGQPVWAELFTVGAPRAREFYTGLLGWGSTEPQEQFGGYTNFTRGEGWIAGLMENTVDPAIPASWTVYLQTDDIHALAKRAEAAGATTIVAPAEVGDLGWFAQFIDPCGAAVGAWQPGTHRGFAAVREIGAPYWFELHAAAHYDDVLPFYREVFGWRTATMSDTPEFRYTQMLGTGGDADDVRAGVMDASLWEGARSAWQVYWMVADVDASFAHALETGASAVHPPHDTPYGRLAVLLDPAGAEFKLAQAVADS
ncbi:VOC family protein [Nocardioides fonticola]|uniref:VOC family protein n=1 Tax=Nocardioides fonticola TaxID=450363 RepID=A0ABP7XHY4_9ACTN